MCGVVQVVNMVTANRGAPVIFKTIGTVTLSVMYAVKRAGNIRQISRVLLSNFFQLSLEDEYFCLTQLMFYRCVHSSCCTILLLVS